MEYRLLSKPRALGRNEDDGKSKQPYALHSGTHAVQVESGLIFLVNSDEELTNLSWLSKLLIYRGSSSLLFEWNNAEFGSDGRWFEGLAGRKTGQRATPVF